MSERGQGVHPQLRLIGSVRTSEPVDSGLRMPSLDVQGRRVHQVSLPYLKSRTSGSWNRKRWPAACARASRRSLGFV